MKRYLIGFGIAMAFLTAVVAALPWLIPLDYDKDEITAEVAAITGRQLTIDGPMRLSLFPLSVEAHGVAFANPPGSLSPAMVKLDTIDVELRVLPLLSGRLEIARFVLKKPIIDLEIDQAGVPNWVFAHDDGAIPSPPPGAVPGGGATAALGRLSIARMHIENGFLSFVNRRNGTQETVSGLNLDIALPGATGPLRINGSGLVENHKYSIDLAGDVSVSDKVASISEASLKFDSIAGTGALSIYTGGARPRIEGSLALHRLDLTPYLPPRKPAEKTPTPVKGQPVPPPPRTSGWDTTAIDFSPLGRIDADLHVTAEEIRLRKFDLGQTELHLVLAESRLELALAKVSAYGGHGDGALTIAGSGPRAAIGLSFTLTGIQIQPLLVDTTGFDRLSGNAGWRATIATQGGNEREFIDNLAGKGALEMVNGSLRGFNLVQMLSNPVGDLTQPHGSTTIEHLTASYTIANGIVANRDLDVKSGNLKANGEGTIDLPAQTLDYRLQPRLGVAIPIRISGPWDALHYRMDMNVLKALSTLGGKPVDAVKQGVGSTASKLKNLFKIP